MRFDLASVGCDHDQSPVLSVAVEALHELTGGLGGDVRQGGIGRGERDRAVERVVGPQAPAARETEAGHTGVVFVPTLADGVQAVLGCRAANADLVADRGPQGREQSPVDGAVLAPGLQVVLRGQRPSDARLTLDHRGPPGGGESSGDDVHER